VSTLLFYDMDILLALDVPKELHDRKPDILMDIAIWAETEKSTKDNMVAMAENHIAVLMSYIVSAVQKEEERVKY
jgi:hypothetical protein